MKAASAIRGRSGGRRRLRAAALLLGLAAAAYAGWIFHQVERASRGDRLQPAQAIVVFGAAEYDGRPSPVLLGRLQRALALYRAGLAPELMVTGGAGGDPHFTEAGVGAAWLRAQGVRAGQVWIDPRSATTPASVRRVTAVLRRRGWRTVIVVSDGYHLFRLEQLFRQRGITAYGAPRQRPAGASRWGWDWMAWRQVIAYLLSRLGINV